MTIHDSPSFDSAKPSKTEWIPEMYEREQEFDVEKYLADISDPEERARTRREFCALEPQRRGRSGFRPSTGSGPQAALNNAIVGADFESYMRSLGESDDDVEDRRREETLIQGARQADKPFLSREDGRAIYDAASFLTQEHNLFFNALITIAYRPLRLSEPDAMTRLLTNFLDESGGRMERWGHPWHYVYVHEHSNERGLHTHVLAHIAPAMRKFFTDWARDGKNSFFWRHCRETSPQAVDIVIKAPTTDRSKAQWQWDRVQYLTKGMDPDLTDRDMTDGTMRPFFDLIAQKENYRRPAGITPFRQRVGGSRLIWTSAQRMAAKEGMPMLSAFGDKAWPYLRLDTIEPAWEAKEHVTRQGEREKRQRAKLVGDGDEEFEAARRAAGLTFSNPNRPTGAEGAALELAVLRRVRAARLHALIGRHPYQWEPRGWIEWWVTLPNLFRWGSLNAKKGLAALREPE
jgi:hypothetical protein